MNDFWKFSNNEWTWVGGSTTANTLEYYGTLGIASSFNSPGGRSGSVSWTDSYGTFWIFGGYGYSSTHASM